MAGRVDTVGPRQSVIRGFTQVARRPVNVEGPEVMVMMVVAVVGV